MEIKGILMLSCKEATYLISLREEQKLGLLMRIRLSFHLRACGPCKRFANQTKAMINELKTRFKEGFGTNSEELSAQDKTEMNDRIRKNIKK